MANGEMKGSKGGSASGGFPSLDANAVKPLGHSGTKEPGKHGTHGKNFPTGDPSDQKFSKKMDKFR